MGSIVVTIEALQGAVDQLTTLGADVTAARTAAYAAVPAEFDVSTLTSTGPAATFEAWALDQAESPLEIVLDTAKLLQTRGETGPVTITYSGPYSIDTLTTNLGDLLSRKLEDATSKEDLEAYLEILGNHRETPEIQEAVVTALGQAGVVTLLNRVGEAGVPMDTVTNAFNQQSEETIAGWVEDDIANPSDIDTNTVTLLAGFGRSPEFSTSLYDAVTPEQMTDAIQHLNGEAFPYGIPGDYDADAQDLYSKFINGAGTSFATYTTAVDDPTALADTWFDAITDDDHQGNAAALTFLIRKGGENAAFDPDFLYNLTEDIYQWERDQDGPVWGPRVEAGETGMDLGGYLFDPDVVVDGEPSTVDAARRVDGLANLLGSMEFTPEAAQKFFANGYEGSGTEGENSRIDYLLQDRTFDGTDGSDDGYGLGVALQAAASGNTTHEYVPGLGYSDEWSAGFATDLFNHVAEHDQAGEDNLVDNKFHGLPGTSLAYGNIGAAYADDIYDMLDNEDFRPTGPTALAIDYETLQKVVGQIGHHDDMRGLESLSTGLLVEGNERFRAMLENNPGAHTLAGLDGLDPQGILDSNGEVLGKVLTMGLESKMSGEELDQARAEFAAKAFDVATSFIPGAGDVVSSVKDTLWETAIDTAKDEGVSALSDLISSSPSPSSGEYAEVQNSQFEDIIRYNTYDQLLRTGYLEDQGIPEVLIVGEGDDRRFRQDIRMDGVDGMPDPDEEGISDAESQQRQDDRDEVQAAINYLLTNNPDVNGPGASLQGLLTDALNGYDRVKPEPEDE